MTRGKTQGARVFRQIFHQERLFYDSESSLESSCISKKKSKLNSK